MKAYIFVLVICLGLPGLSSASPWGVKRNASIISADGKLSICIPASEKIDVALDSLSVSESFLNNGQRETVWSLEKETGATLATLRPGDCLEYGKLLTGYRENVTARELRIGVTYQVRINRFIKNPSRTDIIFYTAAFCPVLIAGKLEFRQYKYEENGAVIRPRCTDKF